MSAGRVFEDRLDPDELAHVGAVLFRAHRLAARPVDDDRRQRGHLHGPDTEIDIVVLVNRIEIVGLVGMQRYRLALQDHLEPIRRRAAQGTVGRADANDGEWNPEMLGDPGADRFAGDFREAVVGSIGDARPVRLGQRAMTLVLVDRAGRAIHESFRLAAVVQELAGMVCVGANAAAPVSRAGIHGGMEDISKVIAEPRRSRRSTCRAARAARRRPSSLSSSPGLPRRAAPQTSLRFASARAIGKAILPGGPRDQNLLAVEHPNLPRDLAAGVVAAHLIRVRRSCDVNPRGNGFRRCPGDPRDRAHRHHDSLRVDVGAASGGSRCGLPGVAFTRSPTRAAPARRAARVFPAGIHACVPRRPRQ